MLRKLQLHNFKCFKSLELDLGHLTVLTGLNGMGKSTVLQSLLFLRQSLINNETSLNGDLIQLGRPQDVFNSSAEDDLMTIDVSFDPDSSWRVGLKYNLHKKNFFSIDSGSDAIPIIGLFGENFQYLSADRWGPRVSLPLSDDNMRHRNLGKYGEYTAHFLAEYGSTLVPNAEIETHPGNEGRQVISQVQAWLSEICPGARIEPRKVEEADIGFMSYSFTDAEVGRSAQYRATNVGYGLSYVLPVIAALISSDKDSLVLIENPEAHLHPRGQTVLGKLMCLAAKAGVQVIVETHSDHVLDGIRIAIKDEKIASTDVKIYFFDRRNKTPPVTNPTIDQNGKIDRWPADFFDESIKNLAILAKK